MKALVSGTGYGGRTIAEQCLKRGWEVTVFDPDITKDVAGNLSRRGAAITKDIPGDVFDVRISRYGDDAGDGRSLSYSEAVEELFDPFDTRTRIEVTGSEGRSIVCALLAHILDLQGRRTYANIGGVMGPYAGGRLVVTDIGDFFAANLLALPLTEYDVMVCEVFEGGSGRADVSVISAQGPADYPVYKGVLGKGRVIPAELDGLCPGAETFGDGVSVEDGMFAFDYGSRRTVTPGTDIPARAVDAVLHACRMLDVPADAVCAGLRGFRGVVTKPESVSEMLDGSIRAA